MDERRVHIDEFFRRQMDNQSETPPPPVWDALEKRLDNPPGRKKTFPVWWFWTIIGLVFISAAGILADVYMDSVSSMADMPQVKHAGHTYTSAPDIKVPGEDHQAITTAKEAPVAPATSIPTLEEKKATIPAIAARVNTPVNARDNNQEENRINNKQNGQPTNSIAEKQYVAPLRIPNKGLNPITNTAAFDKHFNSVTLPATPRVADEVIALPRGKTQTIAGNNGLTPARSFSNVLVPPVDKPKDEVAAMPHSKMQNIATGKTGATPPGFKNLPLPSTGKFKDEVTTLTPGKAQEVLSGNAVNATPVFNNVPIPPLARNTDGLSILKAKNPGNINADRIMSFDANFSKVILPAVYRYKDNISSIQSRSFAAIDDVGALPVAEKQTVETPQAIILPQEQATAEAAVSAEQSISVTDVTELLAAVNPVSTARVIAGGTPSALDVMPATGMDTDVKGAPVAVLQTTIKAMADTTRKKNHFIIDSVDILESETLKPVVAKKRMKLPLEAGVKVGFSNGFNRTWNANKFIIAPYAEAQLPSRFSVIIQPSYQAGKVKAGRLNDNVTSYHEKTGTDFSASAKVVRGVVDSSILTPNPPDTVYRTYTYTQMYDSVSVVFGVKQQQQWDVELPLIVRYKINKNFSVMAGGSVTYSSVLQMREEVKRYSGLKKEYVDAIEPQTFYVITQGQEPPVGPAPKKHDDLFVFGSQPFSAYRPRETKETSNFFRYGFMVGASAVLKDKWMIDVMLHKTGVDTKAVPDKQLQRIYTQPYVRITVGYKIFNN